MRLAPTCRIGGRSGKLTVNAGVRYDQFIGGYPEQYLGPVMFQPTRNLTFPAVTGNNIKDITPRLGVAYDLFGNGKTALKASVGKYMLTAGTVGNPAGITNTVTRAWTDANGNFNPDCDLLNLQSQDLRSSGADFCGVVSSLNFGLPTSVTAFNPDTRFGWGNRPYNWEFSTGVQHQLGPRVAVDVGYFRRWFGNFTTTVNRATTSADYDPLQRRRPARSSPAGRGWLCRQRPLQPQPGQVRADRQLHHLHDDVRQPDRTLERRRRQHQRAAEERADRAGRRQHGPHHHEQL